ncbi:Hypothetical predicted protein [Octopus vulgaris]|uniref:Uncharacterized protein n=1 Tax=Octopus vulgaris TaxID=6645 RepID=A0AA36BUK8_OCTVU|nr:Hypothetical predicted protein [Octopus vulgaris]
MNVFLTKLVKRERTNLSPHSASNLALTVDSRHHLWLKCLPRCQACLFDILGSRDASSHFFIPLPPPAPHLPLITIPSVIFDIFSFSKSSRLMVSRLFQFLPPNS